MPSTDFGLECRRAGKMSNNPLQLNTKCKSRTFNEAVNIDLERTFRPAANGERRIASFGHIDDLGIASKARKLPAISDEASRHAIQLPGQYSRGGERNRKQSCRNKRTRSPQLRRQHEHGAQSG